MRATWPACSSAIRARRSCSRTARSPTSTPSARCVTRTSASTPRCGTRSTCAALLAEAAPEQLLYGSDAPYYTPIGTQAKLFLQLAAVGAGDDRRRDIATRSAARLLAGEPCAPLSEPLAAHLPLPPRPRLRAHEYLVMTVPLIWQQMPDRIGLLALARQALGEPADARAAAALELLALAERTWPLELEHGDRSEILTVSWLTFRLVELADALVMAAAARAL